MCGLFTYRAGFNTTPKCCILNKIYNWIKYKSLPPSTHFKNRLFIERENKHRRVVFNLGLTFRNSKWSDYNRQNLNSMFVTDFSRLAKYVLYLVVFLLVVLAASKYLLFYNATRKTTTLLWFLVDSTLYTKAIMFATWVVSIQQLMDFLFRQFLKSMYGLIPTRHFEFEVDQDKMPVKNATYVRKVFYSFMLVGWRPSEEPEVGLYETPGEAAGTPLYRVYRYFYRFFRSTTLRREVVEWKAKRPKLDPSKAFVHAIKQKKKEEIKMHPALFQQMLDEEDANKPEPRRSNSLWALENKDRWNHPTPRPEKEAWRIKGQTRGGFSAQTTSFSGLSTQSDKMGELSFMDDAVLDQTAAAKWSRWLYKYNLLHRKFLLSSHNNTLTKRLLGSGFYDSSFFTKNVHSQSILNGHSNPSDFFKGSFTEAYANFLFSGSSSGLNTGHASRWLQLNYAPQLSFYEESYLWFAKRFYLFNTLPNLTRVSLPQLRVMTAPKPATTSNFALSATEMLLLQQNELKYFDVLKSVSLKFSKLNGSEVLSSPLNSSVSLSNDLGDLFDYDFTDTAVTLFSNPISEQKETFYFSNFHSDMSTR